MSQFVGQAAQSLGNIAPGFIGGGQGGWLGNVGQYMAPGTTGLFNPGGYFGASSFDPSGVTGPSQQALSEAYLGGPTAPYGQEAIAQGVAGQEAQSLLPAATGGVTPGGGGAGWAAQQGFPTTLGGWLGLGGAVGEAVNKGIIQSNLQNPAAGAQSLYQKMSPAMKRAIIGPVTAAAQETGQINAPGLYSQAVATALAPYQYEMQMNALREYIAAQQAAAGVNPLGGIFGTPGLVPQGVYGGQGQTQGAGQPQFASAGGGSWFS